MVVKFTKDEVARHNHDGSAWIIMNDKVYDVTKFLMEHPGGEDVLLQWAGSDATEAFNDVGHSNDAKELTENYLVGEVNNDDDGQETAGLLLPEEAKREGETESWRNILTSPVNFGWTNVGNRDMLCSVLIYQNFWSMFNEIYKTCK
uniref:Cytochrome b5 n=1 Tax=Globodera pallida TaxID=36090 RepID=A0A183BSG5_GLOPA